MISIELQPYYELDSASGCWNWTKCRNRDGYGIKGLKAPKRNILAHRWFYESLVGPIPAGREIDHLCRNRSCVNPAHLEVVSHRVNMHRGLRTKLSAEQVAKIRALHGTMPRKEIAALFNMSVPGISKVLYFQRHA